jgi:uncharacterized membrane protein
MSEHRTEILDWIAQGRLQSDALPTALRVAGLSPGRADWREFFNYLTLWLGATLCAVGIIFFFAYNWQAMGRFAKFGLVEIFIIASLALSWRLNFNRVTGQALLLFATLLVGALLALVGQTYQTGADTYELFTVWAMAVLPWVAVSCFAPLWLFWLGLINMAATLYYQTFGGLFGWLFDSGQILWAVFILNTAALCIWEIAAYLGVSWLRERWSVRILAVASGSLITILATWTILDFNEHHKITALPVYLVWMTAAYIVYRHVTKDVFVLAGGVLSAIIFITVWLSKLMLEHDDGGAFLFIWLVIITLSAIGGFWLKSVVNEERT